MGLERGVEFVHLYAFEGTWRTEGDSYLGLWWEQWHLSSEFHQGYMGGIPQEPWWKRCWTQVEGCSHTQLLSPSLSTLPACSDSLNRAAWVTAPLPPPQDLSSASMSQKMNQTIRIWLLSHVNMQATVGEVFSSIALGKIYVSVYNIKRDMQKDVCFILPWS